MMSETRSDTLAQINTRIGKRIRTARKTRGMSQTQLGDALGVSFQQIGKYESGLNTISVPTFLTLCRVLRVRPATILEEYVAGQTSQTSAHA